LSAREIKGKFDTLWSFESCGTLQASPVVSNELVVIGDMDGVVYGLDAIDGREHWRTDLEVPSIFASPAIVDGTVFISGFDDLNRSEATTFGLDLVTGAVQWTRDLGQGGRTGVTADGVCAYIPAYDGDCYALSAETGETIWHFDGTRHHEIPALTEKVILLKESESLVALDVERGVAEWRADLSGRVRTPPVLTDDYVYIVDSSSVQWCLDTTTGQTVWHTDIGAAIREHSDTDDPLLPLGGGVLHGKPVTDGKSLVLGIYEGLVELDATDGRLLNYHAHNTRVHDPLLVSEVDDRRLYGHVPGKGMTEFKLTSQHASRLRCTGWETLQTGPAYTDGVLYVATELDGIHALT
jgi:outer membrane protein assembly factor BamB